jgi:predicted GTPase
MQLSLIIYILMAFVLGVVIATFFGKRHKKPEPESMNAMKTENEALKSQLINAERSASLAASEHAKTTEGIKNKYEALLEEAKEQCAKLDEGLKNALNGKIDESVKSQLAEVDKLKKKIKDLEEDIDDYEDDISDLKKKIRAKDEEAGQFHDNLIKEQKVSHKLHEELTSVNLLLAEKVNELEIKMDSLNFIQEILSAREISTDDVNKLNKDIDFCESFLKGQYQNLNSYLFKGFGFSWNNLKNDDGVNQKMKHFLDLFDQWASTKRKSWLDGKKTIAFVGEFSAGKTSIVNRLLSQDDPNIPKLPVSTKATTAIPTYIAGGSIVSYSFISGDAKRKTILEETFKKVSKEVLDQVKGVSALIKYFVMTYKNPNLDGLSILDTPGFNSNDNEDKERTIDVINECDALFWVFDVNAGTVNRSSISIIKEKLNKPLYVVINKVDTKSVSEVNKVEALIKKTLSDEGLKVKEYIRFSSKAPLESIMKPISQVDKISSRTSFIDDVNTDIEKLLSILSKGIKESQMELENIKNRENKLIDNHLQCLYDLQTLCEDAAAIPQWKEHLFSSDRYEMSEEEGNTLNEDLEKINNYAPYLKQLFDERSEAVENIQKTQSKLNNLKVAWQKTDECLSELKKVSKSIA